MPLLAGSPALGTGSTSGAPTTDQRGFPRVVSSKIDMGAFETQISPYQVDSGDDTTNGDEPTSGTGFTIAASPGGAKESGNTVTITTTGTHNLVVGEQVVIAGATVVGYDGTFTVTSVPTSTTFTYTDSTTSLAASGTGSARSAAALSLRDAINLSNALAPSGGTRSHSPLPRTIRTSTPRPMSSRFRRPPPCRRSRPL